MTRGWKPCSVTDLLPRTDTHAPSSFARTLQAELSELLLHLRCVHTYCMYCGHSYDNAEQLEECCPGPTEDLH
jgi:hypothetical protein